MPEKTENIPVFIASPGGLEDERQAAYRIVQEINRANARHWGCQLELVGWEFTLPGNGRPQSIINRELDRCEYFIGVIFDHWGSMPSTADNSYTSGFEEEFERARIHVTSGKMKDISVYFKEIPSDRLRDPGESLKRVIDFRRKCFEEKSALYKEFVEVSDFETAVRSKLTEIGWCEAEALIANQASSDSADMEQSSTREEKKGKPTIGSENLPEEASEFLSVLLTNEIEDEDPNSTDVARFRLIGCSMKKHGNDDEYLGNHDANLLHAARDNYKWSSQEIRSLVSCGVTGFSDQNVPLWNWLERHNKEKREFNYLDVLSVVGSDREKPNAILLSQLLGKPTPTLGDVFDREKTIKIWVESGSPGKTFEVAMNFLTTNGNREDLEILENSINSADENRKDAIKKAIVSIEALDGEATAIEKMLDLQLGNVGETLLEKLFDKPSSLITDQLKRCLDAGDGKVRGKALSILTDRNEVTKEEADQLLSDSDFSVRLQAIEALRMLGFALDEEVVKRTLISTRLTRGLGGLFQPGLSNKSDRSYFDEYRLNRWAELDFEELKQESEQSAPLMGDETSLLFRKFAGKLSADFRTNLKDSYKSYFDKKIEAEAAQFGGKDTDAYRRTLRLIPSIRRRVVSDALGALCSVSKMSDLDLVRNVIDNFEVDSSDELVSFLGRYGEWKDLDRIVGLKEFPISNIGLLSIYRSGFGPEKADALLKISKDRIADLLAADIDFALRKEILFSLTSKTISDLSDEVLISELNRDGDACRIVLSLKCCLHFSKTRVTRLLDKYESQDGHRFYNCIHWLDMGASISSKTTKAVARRELARLRS